jgi:redox-sensing transcriptional repressor
MKRKGSKKKVSVQTIQRLPRYYQYISYLRKQGVRYVSSLKLSLQTYVEATQVRKDLTSIGHTGKPKVGYEIDQLMTTIEDFLGLRTIEDAVVIGVGHLGTAIVQYAGFANYGLRIKAVFDADPMKIGTHIQGRVIQDVSTVGQYVKDQKIPIGILTLPAPGAQEIMNMLVKSGVKAIWNFAPINLFVPDHVMIKNENLAFGLAILKHRLKSLADRNL